MSETVKRSALQQKQAELSSLHNDVKTFWDDHDAAGTPELDSSKIKEVREKNMRIEALEHEVKDLMELDGIRTKTMDRDKRMKTSVNDLPADIDNRDASKVIKSLGHRFVNDAEVKSFLNKVAPGGSSVTSASFGTSPRVGFDVELRSLITGASSTSAGAFIVNQRTDIIDPGTFMKSLDIIDLITMGQTTSDNVEYVRQTGFTNAATAVAEATSTSNGAFPESAATLSQETAPVKTIGHFIPITRNALQDAAQVSSWINSLLLYGLKETLAHQIVNGDGTGANFTGILATSGISSQAWDTDMLTVTRKARTKVRVDGRATPSAYAMNPLDWEAIELTKDGQDRYYFGGPSVISNPRLWGLPVIEAEQFAEGTAMVADWRLAMLWDRMQAAIFMADQHSDYAVKRLVALIAELRTAFAVIRPKAFCEIEMADPTP